MRPHLSQMSQPPSRECAVFTPSKACKFRNGEPLFPATFATNTPIFHPKQAFRHLHVPGCRKCRYAYETLKTSLLSLISTVFLKTQTEGGHFPRHLRQMGFDALGGAVQRLMATSA
jgi:hypothetical protein